MSKSATGANHAIALLDEPEVIRKKIARATTDSEPAVDPENMGPALPICSRSPMPAIRSVTKASVAGMSYGDFKKRVAEAVVSRLEPIQKNTGNYGRSRLYRFGVARGQRAVLPIAEDTIRKSSGRWACMWRALREGDTGGRKDSSELGLDS